MYTNRYLMYLSGYPTRLHVPILYSYKGNYFIFFYLYFII